MTTENMLNQFIDIAKFKVLESKIAKTPQRVLEREEILLKPGFGVNFTDHMAHIRYSRPQDPATSNALSNNLSDDSSNEMHMQERSYNCSDNWSNNWSDYEVIPFANISISPAASVFHYGQEVFEGLKAYKREDGSVWLFRPEMNAKRFNKSAIRLALPELPIQDFLASIAAVISQDHEWIPKKEGESLYIRPFAIATEAFLGVRDSHIVDYYCILSPAANYFGTPEPVDIWVETEYFRAGPGGTGFAKCGGNYAASLLPGKKAKDKGCSQVLYLDAKDQASIEELGGMAFMAVYKDGHVETPEINGQILESITRDTILQILADRNIEAVQTKMNINQVVKDIEEGNIVEAFACGTAAILAPIGRLKNDDFNVAIGGETGEIVEGELTKSLRSEILNIQMGKAPDKWGWCMRIL